MKVAILGYGDQGKSAHEYWLTAGHDVTVCDINTNLELPPATPRRVGADYLKDLSKFDVLVRTPVLHPRDITAANPDNANILDKVTTVTNEFMRICPSKNIVGVTGTKGKGTTSTLITKILETAGHRVHLGGNIGIPPLELIKDDIRAEDWVVLELANFQLIDLKYSPAIAVCLMVVPEHMDWHADYEEYITAKSQLFLHQKPQDIAVYFSQNEDSKRVAGVSPGQKIPYYGEPGAIVDNGVISISGQEVCSTAELKLLGKHNWQNACAAVTAAWQMSQDMHAIRSVLTGFSGLPHRLEFVRELDGIKYYDDSFGTTPETATVAIEAFSEPKVVILGGSNKNASYGKLAEVVKNSNVRTAIVIGETGQVIEGALRSAGFSNIYSGGNTMPEIVSSARSIAQPGDVVLLSTACASFDLFKNYKDRGEQFKQAVQELS